jgi:hypothetical protein
MRDVDQRVAKVAKSFGFSRSNAESLDDFGDKSGAIGPGTLATGLIALGGSLMFFCES